MTTKTTAQLSRSYRDAIRFWFAQRDPIALLSLVIVVPIVGMLLWRSTVAAPPIAAAPTAAPIVMIATASAFLPPTALPIQAAAALPHTLARAVVAYDAPEGHVIGAIDSGHAYQVVARYGVDWIQADVEGSGLVWLRSADVFDLPLGLSDLAPTAAPERITVYVSAPPLPPPPADPPPEALTNHPIVLTADQQAAVDREFGLTPAEMDAALAGHQAREAAFASGQTEMAPPEEHIPTSAEMPCHCP